MKHESFLSLYRILLNTDCKIKFAIHGLFKYVELKDIEDVFRDAGCYIYKEPGKNIAAYVCSCLRHFYHTNRTDVLIRSIEKYATKKNMQGKFAADYATDVDWELEAAMYGY